MMTPQEPKGAEVATLFVSHSSQDVTRRLRLPAGQHLAHAVELACRLGYRPRQLRPKRLRHPQRSDLFLGFARLLRQCDKARG